ncbi:hypothetical protein DINM_006384 [Dirofilaria immitis]|nr:hypothetical protein [Dirofilaria immitis]
MVLLRAPDVTLQFWLRVGKGDGNGKWTNDNVVATSACVEDEKIFLMDYGMLSRLIEEVEKLYQLLHNKLVGRMHVEFSDENVLKVDKVIAEMIQHAEDFVHYQY